jgi:hypothetical protein
LGTQIFPENTGGVCQGAQLQWGSLWQWLWWIMVEPCGSSKGGRSCRLLPLGTTFPRESELGIPNTIPFTFEKNDSATWSKSTVLY